MTRLCDYNGYLYHSSFKVEALKGKDEQGRTVKKLHNGDEVITLKTYIQEPDEEGYDCVFYFEYNNIGESSQKKFNTLKNNLSKHKNILICEEDLSIEDDLEDIGDDDEIQDVVQ